MRTSLRTLLLGLAVAAIATTGLRSPAAPDPARTRVRISWTRFPFTEEELAGLRKARLEAWVEKLREREAHRRKPVAILLGAITPQVKKLDGMPQDVILPLKRFHTYAVALEDLEDSPARAALERLSPALLFFDRRGRRVAEVTGKEIVSVGPVRSALRLAWKRSFALSLKDYLTEMRRLTDRMDKLLPRMAALERRMQRAEASGDEARLAKLRQEQAELEEARNELRDAEVDLETRLEEEPVEGSR